jgi:hypothetical protein
MKIQTFINMKGIIHGSDPKRIGCDTDGVLKIGTTEIAVSSDSVMPTLFYGASGDYPATFTDMYGRVYNLDKVAVRDGRIQPPPPVAVEIMELRCRADTAERERDSLREKVNELEHIFDTDALNFLIK